MVRSHGDKVPVIRSNRADESGPRYSPRASRAQSSRPRRSRSRVRSSPHPLPRFLLPLARWPPWGPGGIGDTIYYDCLTLYISYIYHILYIYHTYIIYIYIYIVYIYIVDIYIYIDYRTARAKMERHLRPCAKPRARLRVVDVVVVLASLLFRCVDAAGEF